MDQIKIPDRLTGRPRYNGFVVPYFVAWYKDGRQCNDNEEGGAPSFPTTDFRRLIACRKNGQCWICGQKLGTYKAFVFGPASALARASYEPPSHRDCARYAMQVCPFLINPDFKHKAAGEDFTLRPDEVLLPDVRPGNPGLGVLWVTRTYSMKMADPSRGIVIFEPGEPEYVELWHRGRKATYKEAADAIQQTIQKNKMLETGNVIELAWRVQQLLKFAE